MIIMETLKKKKSKESKEDKVLSRYRMYSNCLILILWFQTMRHSFEGLILLYVIKSLIFGGGVHCSFVELMGKCSQCAFSFAFSDSFEDAKW